MLEGKQLDKLFQILSMINDKVEDIQAKFLSIFNENSLMFKASFTLNHLMSLNLLTSQQRIISIFLLIENYKSQGIRKHPFGLQLLNISLLTVEAFQRRMIADLIIDSNREKYLNSTLEALFQDEVTNDQPQQQRTQIKVLREEFKTQINNIPHANKKEFYKNNSFFRTKNTISRALQQDSFDQNLAKSNSVFNYETLGNLRPIPDFLQVSASQLTWISPGIIADAAWDNSAQIQKKISRAKQLIKKGMEVSLTKQQYTEVQKTLESQSNGILYMDIYPQHLSSLIRYNPQTVAFYLIKLSNYPILGLYLDTLINLDLSLNIIQVITRIMKFSHLPVQFFQLLVYKNLKYFLKNMTSGEQLKLMRIFSNFVRVLLKNKLLKTGKIRVELEGLMIKYSQFEQIQKLRAMINEQVED